MISGAPGGFAWCVFFGIVNQVLVRLWARRLVEDPREWVPASHHPASAGWWGLRSLTGQGPRRRGYNLAIDGTCVQRRFNGLAGRDAGGFVVCKLSFERCVRCCLIREWSRALRDRGVDGSCT
jgi:hypothetical protein